ncbi:MAG: ABC transporter ATP-binding protein, partial [Clostridia bacterium]|nr:ABC transporter ATP-binding protein [Clostridia bacterium]
RVQSKLDRVNSVVQENVSGTRVVKAYVREQYEIGRFAQANGELRDTNLYVLRLMALLNPILMLTMNLAVIAIILIGGKQAEAQLIQPGEIMAAVTYVTQILHSIMMVSMMFQSISRASASSKRIVEVLECAPVIESGKGGAGNDEDPTCIEFRGVSFRYPGTTGLPVLSDINLKVGRGETVAVIGATGCGKTSLVNLIPRFYDATEGTVLIDGMPAEEWDLTALRQKIGFVMQKSELFSDTIANNIRWGKPDATMEEIKAAAETAQAASFIEGFSDDYETFIAEKGASLSGGQKQRMSIARALVRRPEILILDDATSALDLATEAKLQAALREELKDTTVIMIAQRIASVRSADRIAVIEKDGRILHCAPHDELMQVSETYRDIYQSQMKGGEDK